MKGAKWTITFTRWEDGTWMAAPETGEPFEEDGLEDLLGEVETHLEAKLGEPDITESEQIWLDSRGER